MAENSDDLERLSREQLILKARVLGVERPELMTRVEMRDEIVRRSEPDLAQQKRARGFLGVARDLVASVVEAGLNLPDAAALIRGDGNRENYWKGPPPVATVTLAEIYAAQGHVERALRMLDEVLAKEPDHDPARALRTRLASATDLPASPRRRQKISFTENVNIAVPVDVSVAVEAPAAEPTEAAAVEPELEVAPASAPVAPQAPEPEPPHEFAAAGEAPVSEAVVEATGEAEPERDVSTHEPESVTAEASAPVDMSAPLDVAAPLGVSGLDSPEEPHPAPALAAEPPPAPATELEPASVSAPPPPPPSLLTLSLAGQRQIYWELPPQSLAALRAHSPSGRPVLRVISFRTRSGHVERHSRDLTPDSDVGFAVLPDLRADAVVRAVLGWEVDGQFRPYLVASDLPSGIPTARRNGPFRANPLVGPVAHEVEQRALSHCSRRPAH